MNYLLKTLGDEPFQQLCQAILLCSYPEVQCLPVGQRDGGWDAYQRRTKRRDKFIVFQASVRDPSTREARDFVQEVIKSEKTKVDRSIARGATAYYLLTNVPRLWIPFSCKRR
jgi:hypothetical protein